MHYGRKEVIHIDHTRAQMEIPEAFLVRANLEIVQRTVNQKTRALVNILSICMRYSPKYNQKLAHM